MSTSQTPQTDNAEQNLKDNYTAYQCGACGHIVGDPKNIESWVGQCPPPSKGGCHRMTLFKRVE